MRSRKERAKVPSKVLRVLLGGETIICKEVRSVNHVVINSLAFAQCAYHIDLNFFSNASRNISGPYKVVLHIVLLTQTKRRMIVKRKYNMDLAFPE